MLEKIGLPAKPSMRGGSWVIDATHCQGCSSQFTFINRKHHCRRCGGLFCNSCTQQRMVLRGQGDSPVRICDPCKQIEEAARFELRYGHKSRAAKGNLKHALKHEEEILGQILGTDGKQHLSSGQESHADAISDRQKFGSSASCSSLNESATPFREVGIIKSTSVEMHNAAHTDVVSSSPEELRQQAVEEKKKYKILKAEGKSEEALQAFKRGKELERQAGALEIAIRKSRRMASKASNLSSTAGTQNTDESEELGSKRKLPSQRSKKEKDDLGAELRELGWSDADLHDADKKSVKLSLEGELSNLLGEVTPKSSQGGKTGGIDKSQITAHKKKALLLKREGKLAEAKEELKKAKILEKQLEEQELLGEDEDSDDELSALIRGMDDDKQDDLVLDHAPDPDRNFNHFLGVIDDLSIDGNFEVTDDDINDPELAAALKSFGWSEEDDQATNHVMQSVAVDREALQSQVLALKREALSQKRAGNTAEAMELLKKAKLLEKDLESMQSDAEIFTPELKQETSTTQVSVDPFVAGTSFEESITEISNSFVRSPPKSKLAIQKELLALKKKALTLRREGRLNEAEEELKKGKFLEQQLEEMENAPKRPVAKVGKRTLESTHTHEAASVTVGLGEEGLDAEVTEQDMHDPALLSVLKNLGWNDDDVESVSMTNKPTEQMNDESAHDSVPSVMPRKAMRSKAELQRELLALKRKALALRRQGKTEEAEEMLEKAKALENEMADMENLHNVNTMQVESHVLRTLETQKRSDNQKNTGDVQNTDADLLSFMNDMPKDKVVLTRDAYDVNLKKMSEARKPLPPGSGGKVPETSWHELQKFGKPGLLAAESSIDQPSDLLDFLSGNEEKISRPASGESAWEETPEANSSSPASVPIEPRIQVSAKETIGETEILSHGGSTLHMAQKKEINVATTDNSLAPVERLDHGTDALKDNILARKRRALALKREGKLAEAREELRQAKILEKSLEDGQQSNMGSPSVLASTSDTTSVVQENKTNQSKKPISGRDRLKIQQESLSHKRNALKLRREGKMEESEAELELAKALENQLEELDAQRSSTSTSGKLEAMDDAVVEDLLDPQLMSALKAVGWQDTDFGVQPSRKSESKPKVEKDGNPQAEKANLEEQIKAEKLRALNLKRAGKQPEALEALRSAKHLEKKLALLT
ncbi:uncharacterized protein LOC103713621 isoform X2 [Phoenix dactylifera]|uniref:Uncharacterized protein LOC103713621 isoform X2 n=1 Tax=Phoenix dactylifera TaxID=42345 RepID=A0A8B8ZMR7_PHODC|nr:uncharacterized protein LOC103713621 isoform X2 [Phoenix dactylifera]XP_008798842.1 uncharacterized protein LOC103713621 isoform X2 [Phoenix dactylifera]XP_008798843.1 uncharacterized protein LOC103713621 isoform X2 [Phoenix dactylifera]XP_026662966.1 uncharacterized protein LOC103713621 isoform X2 [Phoenix dactylifera]XP_038975525.1 uncharacterized protein LOC103713621 isoform X2 [Phoenix dactylifera]